MNKRKNRGPLRAQRQRSIAAEGVYNNPHFMHAATGQVGNTARVKTASGAVWEGIFKTFSGNFDVVLELAVKVANPDTPDTHLIPDSLVDKLIFKATDILSMVFKDVDLDFPVRDTFQTDTAIAARLNGNKLEEKELEPWDSGAMNGTDGGLELDNAANGWDPNDMFRKNEQEYGVQSTFDHSLRGYTVPLENRDTADYKEAQARAEQIAAEIENQPIHKVRSDLENGDEEERFAAVVRPSQPQESSASNGKYIPPAKRKNQNNGKLVRSTPPPLSTSSNNGSQSSPSPKDTNRPPMVYPGPHEQVSHQPPPTHQNSHHVSNPHSNAPLQQHQQAPPPPAQHSQVAPPTVNMQAPPLPQSQQQQLGPPPLGPHHHPAVVVAQVVAPNQMVNAPIHAQVLQPIPHAGPRPHVHTPPHHQPPPQTQYQQNIPPPRQVGVVPQPMLPPPQQHPVPHAVPMQQGGVKPHNQMNGEAKAGPQQRQQRHYEAQQRHQQNMQGQPPFQVPPMEIKQEPIPHQLPPRQQQQHVVVPPPQVVHRQSSQQDETMKDLHQFAQEFKLAPMQMQQQQQQQQPPPHVEQAISPHSVTSPGPQNIVIEQGPPQQQIIPSPQPPPPQQQQKPLPQPSPPQPPQSPLQRSSQSPPHSQTDVDKITSTLSKSKLNPNAKEFVLNPTAKPFQPRWEGSVRSPSTPSASRPHTPQTPSHSPYIPSSVAGPGPGQMQQVMLPVYPMMQPTQYQAQPPPGNRIKRIPSIQMRADMASQMQVAAATGQPLLAPAPIQQFITYPAASAHQMNHTGYQPTAAAAAAAMHAAAVRMYDAAAAAAAAGAAPPQIQYLQAHPQQSGTPSPAQSQSYNQAAAAAASLGQGPQGPPTQYQHTFQAAPPQQAPQQIPMAFCIPTQPHIMPNMQYIQQAPPPNHHQQHAHMQAVLMQQQAQAQAQAQAAGQQQQHVVSAQQQHPGQQGGNPHGGPNP